jgi:hypothetical protein
MLLALTKVGLALPRSRFARYWSYPGVVGPSSVSPRPQFKRE